MTKDSDFKAVVRARMRETGENYTQALAAVQAHPQPRGQRDETARPAQESTVAPMFTDARIAPASAKSTTRAAARPEALTRFEYGRV